MCLFLNLDDNVRLEIRGNVCVIKNFLINSFYLKKIYFVDSYFKIIEIYRDLFECIYIYLKNSVLDFFEEISSSLDDSYFEDSEVIRGESRQVRYSELIKDKKRKIFFFKLLKYVVFE